ncbi:MAG: isocitrate lyase/phosphoenolpyruvate mutase family protein [Aestuariivirga sp.]
MSTIVERRAAFRALHQSGCFALPNPWDGGTAKRLERAGFKAIASTSAGAAWALGKDDGEMSVDEVLEHLRFLCKVTSLPVNADFEAGFADSAAGVGANVTRCIATGVAGLSIEDRNGASFYALDEAVERIKAARAAIDASAQNVMLVGRCEAYLMQTLNMEEVIARLRAYSEAGADCLYAPGLKNIDDIARVVKSVDKPVNSNLTATGLSIADMAAVGVRRVSVGAALAKATYGVFDGFVELLRDKGRLP